jgi:hypothetical protein
VSIVKGKIPLYGIALPPTIVLMSLFFFFLYFYIKRNQTPNDRYEFFDDRLVYDVPNGYPSQGTIPYNLIELVEIIGVKPGKKIPIGNLIIRTRSILTSEWQNIALTGIVMMDIENPEEMLNVIKEIMEKHRMR